MRKAEDGWASNYSDWILWEIYAQLTLRMGRPWFIGRWARTVGLNTRKATRNHALQQGMFRKYEIQSPDSRLGPKSMSDLLDIFEGVTIDESVPEIAERILAELGDEVNSLGGLTLEVEESPVRSSTMAYSFYQTKMKGVPLTVRSTGTSPSRLSSR